VWNRAANAARIKYTQPTCNSGSHSHRPFSPGKQTRTNGKNNPAACIKPNNQNAAADSAKAARRFLVKPSHTSGKDSYMRQCTSREPSQLTSFNPSAVRPATSRPSATSSTK
jgi:hypothetical protein